MAPTKAPGPDGFPTPFFQRHWEICGEEIARIVLQIVVRVESSHEINNTVLVPRAKKTTLLSQFRPYQFYATSCIK